MKPTSGNMALVLVLCTLLLSSFSSPAIAPENCRMWGMISPAFSQDVVMSQLVSLPDSLKNLGGGPNGPGNDNGWGLVSYVSGATVVARGQPMAFTDSNFNTAAQALASSGGQIGMGHVRNAATGAFNIPNPHPFVRVLGGKTWTFAHNGVLNIANLKTLIGSTYLSGFIPAVGSSWNDPLVVDSDLYLIYVLKCVQESSWDVKAGIAKAETEIFRTDSSSNANFLLSDGASMWGYKKSVDSIHPLSYKYDASQRYSAIASQPPEGSGLGNWISINNFNLVEISAESPPLLYQDIRSYSLSYPVINYVHAWGYPGGLLDPTGTIKIGESVRIFTRVTDPETPSNQLTVTISYKAQSSQSWTGFQASWEPNYGGYRYYDWSIPAGTTTGLYDVKVEASDPNGGAVSSTYPGCFSVAASSNANPTVNYIHVWGYPGGLLDPAGSIKTGESIRIFTGVSDAETVSSSLTVNISYRSQSGSWTGPILASWEPNYGGYKYLDLTIPGGVAAGLYDVKVEVSDPNGGSASSTESGEFTVVKVNTNPVISYVHIWGYPGGLLDPAGSIKTGESIRIFTAVSDAETASQSLTVTISYKLHTDATWTPVSSSWEPNYGGYKYYDWVIPSGASAGLYDVKVEASDPDGGVATPLIGSNMFTVLKVNANPTISYIHVWGYPGGLLDPAGTIKTGESIRIFTAVSDIDTASQSLTVNISYRQQSGSWIGPILAQWEPDYGGYKYLDLTIPGGAAADLYDVKVDVSDPDGGSITSTETGEFNILGYETFDIKRQAQVYAESTFSEIAEYDYGVTCALSSSQIAELKVYSPTTKLFCYVNFESIYNYSDYYDGFEENGWILLDDKDDPVVGIDYPSEVLVDMGNIDYQDWLIERIENILVDDNYYGVMADNFPRPCVPGFYRVGDTSIINPRTGLEWTDQEWVDAELGIISKCKNAGIILVGNGISQAHDVIGYYSTKTQSDRLIASTINGFLVEGPTAWSLEDFNSRSTTQFKQNLDFLNILVASGKIVFFSNTGASDLETADIAAFSFAQYCLAGYGSTYSFKFREMTYMASSEFEDIVDIDLGRPVENTYVLNSGGLYSRRFSNYVVVCNPTAGALIYTYLDPVISQSLGARESAFIAVN